jgi:hypothetical protein
MRNGLIEKLITNKVNILFILYNTAKLTLPLIFQDLKMTGRFKDPLSDHCGDIIRSDY